MLNSLSIICFQGCLFLYCCFTILQDKHAEKPATASDLQGFWEMIYFQVNRHKLLCLKIINKLMNRLLVTHSFSPPQLAFKYRQTSACLFHAVENYLSLVVRTELKKPDVLTGLQCALLLVFSGHSFIYCCENVRLKT